MSDTLYSNGPLPEFLKSEAWFAPGGNEFAFKHEPAKAYLDWCRRTDQVVLGLETWQPGTTDPQPVDGGSCEGDAQECKTAVEQFTAQFGPDVVFNIWVEHA